MNTLAFRKDNGWTHLPQNPSPLGSKRILTDCSGCHFPCDARKNSHKCMFYSKGLTCNGIVFFPCNVIYHPKCIRVGPPFRTRHYGKGTKGLQYPPMASKYPFICELCTTRTQLGRELNNFNTLDTTLLMLERMRMIDTAHASSISTLEQYGRVLSNVDNFFDSYSLPPLHQQMNLTVISHPPISLAITMF